MKSRAHPFRAPEPTLHPLRRGGGRLSSRHAALLLSLLVAFASSGCAYDRIQELDERAQALQTDIEVQLQRRAELVPNLLETVGHYLRVDEVTSAAAVQARSDLTQAVDSDDLIGMERASARLSATLEPLLRGAERHRRLRTDPGYRILASEMEATRTRLERLRRDYNDAARQYNAYIDAFPQVLTARLVRAQPRAFLPGWGVRAARAAEAE